MTTDLVNLATVAAMTGLSERTVWRRFADGSMKRIAKNGRSLVEFASIIKYVCVPVGQEEISIVKHADKGDPDAQTDLALIFINNNRPKTAVYWLDLAAKQEHPEAMHWLGRCYISGNGVPQNEFIGIMWLAKAAHRGHAISQEQIQMMKCGFVRAPAA